MAAARLAEPGNAARPQHSTELAQDFCGVRDMVKRIEADDAIDRLVGQLEAMSIEQQESRPEDRGSQQRQFSKKAPPNLERRPRGVAANRLTVRLGEEARQPARPRTEIE